MDGPVEVASSGAWSATVQGFTVSPFLPLSDA